MFGGERTPSKLHQSIIYTGLSDIANGLSLPPAYHDDVWEYIHGFKSINWICHVIWIPL